MVNDAFLMKEEEMIKNGEYKFIVDIEKKRVYCNSHGSVTSYIEFGDLDIEVLRKLAAKEESGLLYFHDDISLFEAIPLVI